MERSQTLSSLDKCRMMNWLDSHHPYDIDWNQVHSGRLDNVYFSWEVTIKMHTLMWALYEADNTFCLHYIMLCDVMRSRVWNASYWTTKVFVGVPTNQHSAYTSSTWPLTNKIKTSFSCCSLTCMEQTPQTKMMSHGWCWRPLAVESDSTPSWRRSYLSSVSEQV